MKTTHPEIGDPVVFWVLNKAPLAAVITHVRNAGTVDIASGSCAYEARIFYRDGVRPIADVHGWCEWTPRWRRLIASWDAEDMRKEAMMAVHEGMGRVEVVPRDPRDDIIACLRAHLGAMQQIFEFVRETNARFPK